MFIAGIVITVNEEFRLSNWVRYHDKYKDQLYRHIIVDNGSDPVYSKLLRDTFTDSVIIRNDSNTGSTGAYNAGIRHALSDPLVDSILLIGNDIETEADTIPRLYEFLYSSPDYSVVAPILLRSNSDLVESYGIRINPSNLRFEHQFEGTSYSSVSIPAVFSDSIPGAMNLSKREFFDKVGLLNEDLFMYAEEVDLGIRARLLNLKIAVTASVKAWHQHVNRNNSDARSALAGFLMGRNEIIIAKKFFGRRIQFNTILYRSYIGLKALAGAYIKMKSRAQKRYNIYFVMGVVAGILNIKKMPMK